MVTISGMICPDSDALVFHPNSRNRALIALIHTVIFLTVAALQAALSHAAPFHSTVTKSAECVAGHLHHVTRVLLVLLRYATPVSACISPFAPQRCLRLLEFYSVIRPFTPVLGYGCSRPRWSWAL
jgi:hypothetical protein